MRGVTSSQASTSMSEPISPAEHRGVERRESCGQMDRRRHPTPRLSRYSLLGGRRCLERREVEAQTAFVDRYGSPLLLLLLWIALMNVADSFFTLLHLQRGGVELNPIADLLLMSGRRSFVTWKAVLIGLALLVLCVHKNFYLARLGLWLSALTYTSLVVYHLALFNR